MRIEQIGPMPYSQVSDQIAKYPNAEICWAQEEHRNQGAFNYIRPRFLFLLNQLKRNTKLRYIGRKISGSTAVGSLNTHKLQLEEILEDAFSQ